MLGERNHISREDFVQALFQGWAVPKRWNSHSAPKTLFNCQFNREHSAFYHEKIDRHSNYNICFSSYASYIFIRKQYRNLILPATMLFNQRRRYSFIGYQSDLYYIQCSDVTRTIIRYSPLKIPLFNKYTGVLHIVNWLHLLTGTTFGHQLLVQNNCLRYI